MTETLAQRAETVAMRAMRETRLSERRKQENIERAEREARERQWARGQAVLAASSLKRWFPGTRWDIMDFQGIGTAIGVTVEDGSSIIVSPDDRSFQMCLQGKTVLPEDHEGAEVILVTHYMIERKSDTGMSSFNTGYDYYDGAVVKSVEDIGKWLVNRDPDKRLLATKLPDEPMEDYK